MLKAKLWLRVQKFISHSNISAKLNLYSKTKKETKKEAKSNLVSITHCRVISRPENNLEYFLIGVALEVHEADRILLLLFQLSDFQWIKTGACFTKYCMNCFSLPNILSSDIHMSEYSLLFTCPVLIKAFYTG